MLIIDAINAMIAPLGETAIDPTDPDYTLHPLYESALRILNSTSSFVQSRGWWFNTVNRTLTPVANAIALAADVLTVEVTRDTRQFAIRDGAMYNMTDDTATITSPLLCVVRTLVGFEDLPETAAAFISLKAAERFVKAYDGDRGKLSDVQKDAAEAFIMFNSDHIRSSRVNLYQTRTTGQTLANTWYTRYQQR